MISSKYAPVVIFAYNREEEIRNLIVSLSDNDLADQSDIIVFSDGPKDDRDLPAVENVRKYLDSIGEKNFFKSVCIYKSENNKGLASSVISGVTKVIEEYGKVIVLEDDLKISKYFLVYMNSCLEYYRSDERIWSVSGYTPGLNTLKGYDKEVYLSTRAFSNGWGMWSDRWNRIEWDADRLLGYAVNLRNRITLSRGGNNLLEMLTTQKRGQIDSWAVRWCASMCINNMYMVVPVRSLVEIGGLDNGTHSAPQDKERYHMSGYTDSDGSADWCVEDLLPDEKINAELRKIFHISMMRRMRIELGYWRRRIRNREKK